MRRFIFIVLLCIVFEFSTLFCIRAEADVVDLGIFNEHQYFYDTGSFYSFDEARQAARAVQGRDLVSITSAAENDFLATAIASMPNAANNLRAAWIGLFRVATTDPWVWVSSEPVSYSNWRPAGVGYYFAEPTGETAGVMYINGENNIPLGLWGDSYYAGYEAFNAIYETIPRCDFSIEPGIEKCFGGIGRQCLDFTVQNPDECKVHGSMSVGSILHDKCCIETDNKGVGCDNPDGRNTCKKEWDLALDDTLNCDRIWETDWGPYFAGGDGDCPNKQDCLNLQVSIPPGAQLSAPPGAIVHPKYEQYCKYGKCEFDAKGKTIIHGSQCKYCICWDKPLP